MQAETATAKQLDFKSLPDYAAYLLNERLDDWARHNLAVARELKLPLLKFFDALSDDEIHAFGKRSGAEFLTYLVNNDADAQIAKTIERWLQDQVPNMKRDDVASLDVALVNHMRRKSLLHFLPDYTADTTELLEIVDEINRFMLASETLASQTYIGLYQERLQQREDQLLEAQELAAMGSFVWDLATNTSDVTPQVTTILELDQERGFENYLQRIHPDDRAGVEAAIQHAVTGNGMFDCEYRYETRSGEKRIWSRGVVTFHQGVAQTMKGTVTDITERHRLVKKLEESEALYKQAEALTHIGNWRWDLTTNALTWSDEMCRIYGLEPGTDVTFERFIGLIHPDDRERVTQEVQTSLAQRRPNDFFHRVVLDDGTEKTIHAKGDVVLGSDGQPVGMLGTGQDVTERQKLLEQFKRSDRLYKQAQALARIGNWSWDVATNEVTWSDELFAIHGLEPNAVTPTFDLELSFIHPDDRERVSDAIAASLKNNRPGEVQYRLVLKDGSEKIIHGKSETLADANGWVYRMTGTAQDVTDQHRVEQQLRENQNFIQKVANATPSIITTYNINTGVYRYVNEGLEKLLGYAPQEALQRGVEFFVDLVHPDDIGPITEQNAAALEKANSQKDNPIEIVAEFTYRMRHKNGEYRWFHTYGTVFDRNANGLVEHVLNISLDVTARVRAEQRVKEQESFIQHIADASPTVLYLFDLKEAKVVYVNAEITAALGYTPDEIITMGNLFAPSVYHPEDWSKSPEAYPGYKTSSGVQPILEYECRMKHKHDNWRWMLVREMIYERDADGIPTSVLGAALDISDRKSMETMLMRRTQELQQTNANLAEFAYVASHDLKEPLRKIQVFADRIAAKEAGRLSESGQDWFKRMQNAATRMENLIDDLLSFSRTNTAEKKTEPVDLNALLTLVKTDLSAPIEKSAAVIQADPLPTVNGIHVQLRQLFQNLLSNGIKFRKPDVPPVLRITSETLPGNEVEHPNAAKNKRYLKLSFADNGIGFEPEYAEKIFGLFQRLHGKSEYPGTGIGLSLCRKVVENHDGFIVAEGKPGVGAVFTVYLPVS